MHLGKSGDSEMLSGNFSYLGDTSLFWTLKQEKSLRVRLKRGIKGIIFLCSVCTVTLALVQSSGLIAPFRRTSFVFEVLRVFPHQWDSQVYRMQIVRVRNKNKRTERAGGFRGEGLCRHLPERATFAEHDTMSSDGLQQQKQVIHL